jgi:hypothetical protein
VAGYELHVDKITGGFWSVFPLPGLRLSLSEKIDAQLAAEQIIIDRARRDPNMEALIQAIADTAESVEVDADALDVLQRKAGLER